MSEARRADAALLWALILLGSTLFLAGDDDPPPPRPCTDPVAVGAEIRVGEPVVRVACDGAGRPIAGAAGLLFGRPIEINRAPPEDLEVIPGIGPARARALVAERCRTPFRSLADLQRVHGIGPVTVERLAGWAVAGPPPKDCGSPSTTLPP